MEQVIPNSEESNLVKNVELVQIEEMVVVKNTTTAVNEMDEKNSNLNHTAIPNSTIDDTNKNTSSYFDLFINTLIVLSLISLIISMIMIILIIMKKHLKNSNPPIEKIDDNYDNILNDMSTIELDNKIGEKRLMVESNYELMTTEIEENYEKEDEEEEERGIRDF
jgi:hypothetical protein